VDRNLHLFVDAVRRNDLLQGSNDAARFVLGERLLGSNGGHSDHEQSAAKKKPAVHLSAPNPHLQHLGTNAGIASEITPRRRVELVVPGRSAKAATACRSEGSRR